MRKKMDCISIMGLSAWDMDFMTNYLRCYPELDNAEETFAEFKFGELMDAGNEVWGNGLAKYRGHLYPLCRKKRYPIEDRGLKSMISVLGEKHLIESPMGSRAFFVTPLRLCEGWGPEGERWSFFGTAEALIQTLEIYGKAMEELPAALEKARFEAIKECSISKMLLPKLRKDLKSSRVLKGLIYRTDMVPGERIQLKVLLPGGGILRGIVDFDNYGILFERLPLALSDPENAGFYIPFFSFTMHDAAGGLFQRTR